MLSRFESRISSLWRCKRYKCERNLMRDAVSCATGSGMISVFWYVVISTKNSE
jgi:hypothetical protein